MNNWNDTFNNSINVLIDTVKNKNEYRNTI